jgi:ankyrin repeat protein
MLNHFYDQEEEEITDNIHTRFLLAQLLMDSFRDKLTVRDVKTALRDLPQGSDAYDVAYHAAMERIFAQGEGSSKMAEKILAWILCAHRPLSTLELLHALAVEPGDKEIDEDNILETDQILTICAGLVTIDEQSNNVRFIHYTTQEYLQRNQADLLPNAKIEIARSCTAYLCINDFAVGPCSSVEDYDHRVEKFALLDYATKNWGPHMTSLMGQGYDSGIVTEGWSLLLNVGCLSTASQTLFMSDERSDSKMAVKEMGEGFLGCHWLGRFGLLALLEDWIARKYEINQRDCYGRTPMSWAAENGHEATVKQLLDTGRVDVDWKDNDGWTPLAFAAASGHQAIVKQLLDVGKADIDLEDNEGRTPLELAAASGYEAIVKQLLDTGKVNVNSKDDDGRTPLAFAAASGHQAIVKQLLDVGKADVDLKDNDGRTAILLAAMNGHEGTVKQLLISGKVDVNSTDNAGWTSLVYATINGHEAIVKQLRDTSRVDIGQPDKHSLPPLAWTALNGHEGTVKQLLISGKVDVDSKDKYGLTSLSRAAKDGRETIVKQLLDTSKVNVNSKNNTGITPLAFAAANGHEAIVKQLLNTGKVNVNSKNNRSETPLDIAAAFGHQAIMKQLLDVGKADVGSIDKDGQTGEVTSST